MNLYIVETIGSNREVYQIMADDFLKLDSGPVAVYEFVRYRTLPSVHSSVVARFPMDKTAITSIKYDISHNEMAKRLEIDERNFRLAK